MKIKLTITYPFTIVFAIFLLFSSCKHDETISDPTIQNSFGKFYYQDSLRAKRGTAQLSLKDSVSFGKNERIIFTAKFSVKTAWILSIVGKQSKALKTISGNTNFLDATNATWDGSSDVPTFPADTAIATLTFPNDKGRKSMSRTIIVSSSKNFGSNPNYIVVADFTKSNDANASFNNDPNVTHTMVNGKPNGPPIGGNNCTFNGVKNINGVTCYDVGGVEDTTTSYYMGGLLILPSLENPGFNYFPIVPPNVAADSDVVANTFFNIWVYGYRDPLLKMTVQFNESDFGNSDYQHIDAKDDTWEMVIYPTWDGWKQVSLPMNVTTISGSLKYGGSGNHIREINRIVSITINIATEKSAAGHFVRETYTYPIFSKGAPFNY